MVIIFKILTTTCISMGYNMGINNAEISIILLLIPTED